MCIWYTGHMKRATLLLEDGLFSQAKILSRQQGKTLKEVVNDLLRIALSTFAGREATAPKKFKIPENKHIKPLPGVDISDRNSLYDIMEGIKVR